MYYFSRFISSMLFFFFFASTFYLPCNSSSSSLLIPCSGFVPSHPLFIPSIISSILSFAALLFLLLLSYLFLITPPPCIPSSPSFASSFRLCSFSSTDSEHFCLLENLFLRSSLHPKLRRDERDRVKSCFPAMWERVELSGCVWGGRESKELLVAMSSSVAILMCSVVFLPWVSPLATLSGCVCTLTPFPILPFLMYSHINSKHVHMCSEVIPLLQRPALNCQVTCIHSLCGFSDTWITRIQHAIRAWVWTLSVRWRLCWLVAAADVWWLTWDLVL